VSMGDIAAQDSYEIDPMTGAVMNPSPYAQGKFERIATRLGAGMRDWFQTPGRAYKEGLAPEEATDWGAGTALSMLGVGAPLAMVAPSRGASAGIFGGKLAETADRAALRQAQSLEKTGTDPGTILDTTGWEKRPDKQWRFEINDRDAAMQPDAFKQMRMNEPLPGNRPDVTVSEVFKHPDLYAAYPWVGDMPARRLPAVDKFGQPNTTRGGYDPQGKAVYLREDLTPEQARLTMLHEAQHAIQGAEGFAEGGSLSAPAVVRRGDKQLEQTVSAAEQRFNTLRDQMLSDVTAQAPSGNPTRAQIDKWKADNPALAIEMDRAFDTFSAPGGANRSASRFQAYRSLQGETEARNVAARADLIPEQRYLMRPEVTEDVARAQQWVNRDRKRGKMGDVADTAAPGMMQDTPAPARMGSVLAAPEEINRAAAASAQGITQPALRKLYGELGLTGGAPSELLGPSLGAAHDAGAIKSAIDLKLADRAVLDTMTPKQRQGFALGGKVPEGFTLPSREAGAAEREAYKPLKKEITKAEAAFDAGVARGDKPSIFDLSAQTLMKTPDVPQFNLPRVAPEQTERLASVPRGGLQRVERAAAAAPEENWGWYNLQQARDRFHDIHGKARGEQAFNAWLDSVAGTSMVNPIDNNLRSSTWYLQQILEGKPLPETMQIKDPGGKSVKLMVGGPPAGYGAKSQIQHADRVREYLTNSYDPVTNPKPISYRMNLGGNWMPRTVDTHDIRNLVGMPAAKEIFKEDAALLPKEYAYLESIGQRAADRAGAPQAAQQAATWVGGGKYTGLKSYPAPLMEALNRRAHVTGAVRDISPEQALREAFSGKAPLLGLGGAAVAAPGVMGGLASQDRYE